MNRFSLFASTLTGTAASLLLISCGESDSGQQGGPPPAFPVQVANPIQQEVALTETFTGRFIPIEEVDLRARVSGYIESVHFEEGKKVKKGDLMFTIDPRMFDAKLAAAEAGVAQAEARVKLAESNMKRTDKLVKSNAVSGEEADIRRSEFAQAKADLLAAQASADASSLDREYSEVRAPISGIAGKFEVTPGNFISGGTPGSDLLTTIVPHSPIHCVFEVDERQVLQFTRMFFQGKTDGRGGEQPTVEIAVSDSDEFEFTGKIDFADNQLDESTATNRLRAIVENENEFLTPGLFARVRVPIGEPFEAILVRDDALGFDQSKRFAWVVQEDGTVKRKFVEVGNLEGEMRIIKEGLGTGDTIVVSGIQLLRDGMPVEATNRGGAEESKPPGEAPAAPAEGGESPEAAE